MRLERRRSQHCWPCRYRGRSKYFHLRPRAASLWTGFASPRSRSPGPCCSGRCWSISRRRRSSKSGRPPRQRVATSNRQTKEGMGWAERRSPGAGPIISVGQKEVLLARQFYSCLEHGTRDSLFGAGSRRNYERANVSGPPSLAPDRSLAVAVS